MRGWSIFFGILIFASIVSVSFSHTVDLYLRVGFLLWEARLATFAVEATFLLSGWSILWYRMQKKDPGKAAYLGFSFGLFMALFSNSAYSIRSVSIGCLAIKQLNGYWLYLSLLASEFPRRLSAKTCWAEKWINRPAIRLTSGQEWPVSQLLQPPPSTRWPIKNQLASRVAEK